MYLILFPRITRWEPRNLLSPGPVVRGPVVSVELQQFDGMGHLLHCLRVMQNQLHILLHLFLPATCTILSNTLYSATRVNWSSQEPMHCTSNWLQIPVKGPLEYRLIAYLGPLKYRLTAYLTQHGPNVWGANSLQAPQSCLSSKWRHWERTKMAGYSAGLDVWKLYSYFFVI